ncbi:bola protein [Rhodotorula diobovata]|uniref:Bola protein n=1 Tax=Rhodotorula diobovata TaxID=5288 RepID=A0A5C5FZ94_9BASI|nr:bola protein [Rhodotorula diobovata]
MLSRTTLTALRSATRAPAAFPSLASSSSSTPLRPFSSSLARPSDNLTDGEKLLKDRLEQGLEGAKVQVQDVSGGCGSFYAISVEHSSFKGLSMIKQHRVVNELLKDEIKDMHGLQLKTKAA